MALLVDPMLVVYLIVFLLVGMATLPREPFDTADNPYPLEYNISLDNNLGTSILDIAGFEVFRRMHTFPVKGYIDIRSSGNFWLATDMSLVKISSSKHFWGRNERAVTMNVIDGVTLSPYCLYKFPEMFASFPVKDVFLQERSIRDIAEDIGNTIRKNLYISDLMLLPFNEVKGCIVSWHWNRSEATDEACRPLSVFQKYNAGQSFEYLLEDCVVVHVPYIASNANMGNEGSMKKFETGGKETQYEAEAITNRFWKFLEEFIVNNYPRAPDSGEHFLGRGGAPLLLLVGVINDKHLKAFKQKIIDEICLPNRRAVSYIQLENAISLYVKKGEEQSSRKVLPRFKNPKVLLQFLISLQCRMFIQGVKYSPLLTLAAIVTKKTLHTFCDPCPPELLLDLNSWMPKVYTSGTSTGGPSPVPSSSKKPPSVKDSTITSSYYKYYEASRPPSVNEDLYLTFLRKPPAMQAPALVRPPPVAKFSYQKYAYNSAYDFGSEKKSVKASAPTQEIKSFSESLGIDDSLDTNTLPTRITQKAPGPSRGKATKGPAPAPANAAALENKTAKVISWELLLWRPCLNLTLNRSPSNMVIDEKELHTAMCYLKAYQARKFTEPTAPAKEVVKGYAVFDKVGDTQMWICPEGVTAVKYLIIGGGGSGAACYGDNWKLKYIGGGGGGGGGAVLEGIMENLTPNKKYNVAVGGGGEGVFRESWGGALGLYNLPGIKGGDSSFHTMTAPGGRGGGESSFRYCNEGGDSGSGFEGGRMCCGPYFAMGLGGAGAGESTHGGFVRRIHDGGKGIPVDFKSADGQVLLQGRFGGGGGGGGGRADVINKDRLHAIGVDGGGHGSIFGDWKKQTIDPPPNKSKEYPYNTKKVATIAEYLGLEWYDSTRTPEVVKNVNAARASMLSATSAANFEYWKDVLQKYTTELDKVRSGAFASLGGNATAYGGGGGGSMQNKSGSGYQGIVILVWPPPN